MGKGGEGKGYQGKCFNCHEVGHKAAECTKAKVVAGVDQAPRDLGRVEWDVCAVEVTQPEESAEQAETIENDNYDEFIRRLREDAVEMYGPQYLEQWPRHTSRTIAAREREASRNSFDALREDDEDECGVCGEWPILKHDLEDNCGGCAPGGFAKLKQLKKEGKKSTKRLYKPLVPSQVENLVSKDPKSILKDINIVDGAAMERKIVQGKITVDSGAAESVWPADMVCEDEELEQKDGMIGFVAANGAQMTNYGKKVARFVNVGESADDSEKAMGFHVTDVRKPLAAVSRIVDKGNRVVFGPKPEDNYIMNIKTGRKMYMKRERGVFVLDVGFLLPKDEEVPAGFTRQA